MKIGKFKASLIYNFRCDKCGEFRSNIGWSTISIFTKPTSKILRKEGWNYVEGVGQLCPECSKTIKKGD